MRQDDIFNLNGQVALVTGAGQNVGREIAIRLAQYGAGGVAVNDFVAERAEAVAAEINALGVKAIPVVGDVGDLNQVHAGIERATAELGPVTILVNNAGNAGPAGFSTTFPLFWETEPADWERFFRVNLYGVMNCCRAALPGMVAQQRGRVVTVVSDAGRLGEPRMADYSAAKAGAAGFMRGLARDAGRFGITANSIALGTIQQPVPAEQLDAYMQSDRVKAQLAKYVIRRYGQPSDVAAMALFLCSDAAAWVTGQTYPVNGGYSFAT